MKKVMLIGETRAGKSSLIRALSGIDFRSHRAMAVEYVSDFINTPGEFLENSWFYHALITSSADCDIVLMVQDATRNTSLFPPLFAPIFNRPVIGVISKMDLPNAIPERAERFLRNAGARTIVPLSVEDETSLDALRGMLA